MREMGKGCWFKTSIERAIIVTQDGNRDEVLSASYNYIQNVKI
jgi:hypothetical protein